MLDEINPYIDDLKTDLWSFPSNSNENNFKIILLIGTNWRPSTEHRNRFWTENNFFLKINSTWTKSRVKTNTLYIYNIYNIHICVWSKVKIG